MQISNTTRILFRGMVALSIQVPVASSFPLEYSVSKGDTYSVESTCPPSLLYETEISFNEPLTSIATKIDLENYLGYIPNLDFLFNDKLVELSKLKDDWDGYDGIPPNRVVLQKTQKFINLLPNEYLWELDEEDITPTSHGTVVMEWRPKEGSVISVEIGQSSYNYYAFHNGQVTTSPHIYEMDTHLSENLLDIFENIISETRDTTNFGTFFS